MEQPYTLEKRSHLAFFSTRQTKYIKRNNTAVLRPLVDSNNDDSIRYVNALLERPKSAEVDEKHWFPTSQEPGDETQHTRMQKRILQELIALEKLEQLNPQDNQ